jgi:hypothetical protein
MFRRPLYRLVGLIAFHGLLASVLVMAGSADSHIVMDASTQGFIKENYGHWVAGRQGWQLENPHCR